jgi:hypothetical protein
VTDDVGAGDVGADPRDDGVGFVNWTSADDRVAMGQLHGLTVLLVGTLGSGAVVDGSFPLFSSSAYSPPVAVTDTAYVVGAPAEAASPNHFTLVFGGTVSDPVLHLHSLGSSLAFEGDLTLRKLSGDSSFDVRGSTISGGGAGAADADGSAQIVGPVRVLRFSARNNNAGGSVDGIYLQLCSRLP